jgi:prepilin peptidase CpaA
MLTASAAWTDHRTGLIPNRLTLSGMALGLVLAAAGGGGHGILLAAAGAFAAGLVPLVLFRMKAMGGGDVKLFFALGALIGAGAALEIQALSFLVGAAQGLVVWYRQGRLVSGLKGIAVASLPFLRLRAAREEGVLAARATEIRFGPAIFLATVAVIASRTMGWF